VKAIALAVNPRAGTDIRRFSTFAASGSYAEKVQTALRLITAASAMGAGEFILMPDYSGIANEINLQLLRHGIKSLIHDMRVNETANDTAQFTADMHSLGCGCIISLGGDGTARAIAKESKKMPLLPVSTGTNNVYPYMIEGTAGGIAAAGIASGEYPEDEVCIKDKQIEVSINGVFRDIALVDAVVSSNPLTGAKALQNKDELLHIISTRCHPATIGFSAITGSRCIVTDRDDFGVSLPLKRGGLYIAPISSGVLTEVQSGDPHKVLPGEALAITADINGTIALDGERELTFVKGDELSFKITRGGPLRVLIEETCECMLAAGAFSTGAAGVRS
jgi:hypothetical protein